MNKQYDMCIDYEVLCELEKKLRNISVNLGKASDSMLYALRNSGEYLSGNQFDKASQTTIRSTEMTRKTIENISEVLKYLSKLKECLEAYSTCGYN